MGKGLVPCHSAELKVEGWSWAHLEVQHTACCTSGPPHESISSHAMGEVRDLCSGGEEMTVPCPHRLVGSPGQLEALLPGEDRRKDGTQAGSPP